MILNSRHFCSPLALLICMGLPLASRAEIQVYEKDGWKFSTGGFFELDAINDSTRSYRETMGNAPVLRSDNREGALQSNGANPRTQFSIRHTRLAFTLLAPPSDGLTSKAYLETDFFGYNAAPPGNQTETSYYANPALRLRHAYYQGEKGNWQWTVGQTWQLLGWQPYYFIQSVDVAPLGGSLYSRTAQVRGMYTAKLDGNKNLQLATAILRPPQADSQVPDLQAGARLSFGNRTSGLAMGPSNRTPQPASLGVSAALRQFSMPVNGGAAGDTSVTQGQAVALNAMLPVIASSDNKDVSNTLSLAGEWSSGVGYGDQFNSWTGNTANPLQKADKGYASTINKSSRELNLDGGIGDYDSGGNFQLISLQSWNAQLQYHLPKQIPFWCGLGYGELRSSNVSSLTDSTGLSSNGKIPYDNNRLYFGNVFHELNAQTRLGLEYVHTITHYADSVEATNNRIQAALWWRF